MNQKQGAVEVSMVVQTVVFLSVAALPWVWLVRHWRDATVLNLAVMACVWLVIGVFAAASSERWQRKPSRRGG